MTDRQTYRRTQVILQPLPSYAAASGGILSGDVNEHTTWEDVQVYLKMTEMDSICISYNKGLR